MRDVTLAGVKIATALFECAVVFSTARILRRMYTLSAASQTNEPFSLLDSRIHAWASGTGTKAAINMSEKYLMNLFVSAQDVGHSWKFNSGRVFQKLKILELITQMNYLHSLCNETDRVENS